MTHHPLVVLAQESGTVTTIPEELAGIVAEPRDWTDRLIATAVVVATVILIYWVLSVLGRRFVRILGERSPDSGPRADTLWRVTKRVILAVVVLVTILIVVDIWGLSSGPFVAIGAAIAAAVGFGAQNFVRDVIAGFFILFEDQYHLGDTVTIAGATGTVEDVQLRVTVLRDSEGTVHFVPNGQIVVTSNATSRYAQPLIDVAVASKTDVPRALSVMTDELRKMVADPDWSGKIRAEPEVLGVIEMDGTKTVLRARLTTAPNERWAVRREAMLRIKQRYDAEGITLS